MKQGRNTHAPSFDNNFFVRGIVDDFNNSEVEGKL